MGKNILEKKLNQCVVIDIADKAAAVNTDWENFELTDVNDHVLRMSVLQRDFHWHYHESSDETFVVWEGKLYVDLEGGTLEVLPGQIITIPKNVKHRTRSTQRTVILCFESKTNDVIGIS